MTDFVKIFHELLKQEEGLQSEIKANRIEALNHIQKVIDLYDIQAFELNFIKNNKKQNIRRKTRMKYQLPTGECWSGKGSIKREFVEYLNAHGLTKDDLHMFLIKTE